MDTEEKPTTSRCIKLHELPPVVSDWQQKAWCPDCDYYHCGLCGNPVRGDSNAACPFDGKVLLLRQVTVETPSDRPKSSLTVESCEAQESQPRFKALEQAIRLRIVNRTGGRIQMLVVEIVDDAIVIRGIASCFYVKQLALHAVLGVLDPALPTQVKLDLKVPESVAMSTANSQ